MKILIIDDDQDILLITSTVLRKYGGFEVIQAESGQKALDWAHREAFDLILMDYMLEDIDGPALLEKLREDKELDDIPVIFLTAKSDLKLASLYQKGVKGIIQKPFDPSKIVEDIQQILNE